MLPVVTGWPPPLPFLWFLQREATGSAFMKTGTRKWGPAPLGGGLGAGDVILGCGLLRLSRGCDKQE